MKRVLFIWAIVATAAVVICCMLLGRSTREISRLRSNEESLLGSVEQYKTRAERSAASVAMLELRLDELKRLRSQDAEQIRTLGIRLRRVESYAKSVTESRSVASLPIRDTIILHDTIKLFAQDLGHTALQGSIAHDTLHIDLKQRDTLFQAVHRVPRKFLFFRFGTRAIHQDVWTSNPNTEIVYTEYIELSKPERTKRRRRGR